MLFDAPMSVRFKGASHTLIGKMQGDNAKMHHLFGLYKDSKKICTYFHCTYPLEIHRQISCFTHSKRDIYGYEKETLQHLQKSVLMRI